MNMNREQIVTALECCVKVGGKTANAHYCNDCPLDGERCALKLPKNALALIRELTEEKERVEKLSEDLGRDVDVKLKYILELEDKLETTKADTVQKMQERLKSQSFAHKNFGELVYVEDIDQIAKELLEENT